MPLPVVTYCRKNMMFSVIIQNYNKKKFSLRGKKRFGLKKINPPSWSSPFPKKKQKKNPSTHSPPRQPSSVKWETGWKQREFLTLTQNPRRRLLPTLSRSAACPSPGATPSSTSSPSPPWSLGCGPRRSRGKAWLPEVLDATCKCLPQSCSPQLPYTAALRPASPQRIRVGFCELWERHGGGVKK